MIKNVQKQGLPNVRRRRTPSCPLRSPPRCQMGRDEGHPAGTAEQINVFYQAGSYL
jgi:hypothetical protein